jgi:hypothetical protein
LAVAIDLPDEMPSRWLEQIRVMIQVMIQDAALQTRRHFDVVAEGLRSDVRAIAEGHVTLSDKLDRFQDEVRREFRRVDRRLLRLEARR